jgi:O-antigen/teichoic acid export membrane protein
MSGAVDGRAGTARRRDVLQDPEPASVAAGVRSGLGWSLLNNAVLRFASLVAGIVLARILSPADYGVYAIALTVLVLLQSANELGVSLALVQRPGDVRQIAPTVMTIGLASSAVMYAVAFSAAPAICAWLGAPEAVGVIRLMSLAVVVDGVATVPIGLLNRFFLQQRLFVGEAMTFITSTAVTIALALYGFGAFAFAWGTVVGGVVGTMTHLCLAPFRVSPGWNRQEAGSLLRFGLPLAGASLLVLSVANVDNLVVGAVLGQALLGYYLLAFRQSSWPVVLFAEAARRVALAGFSRLVHDTDLVSHAFSRALALLVAAVVPPVVLLAAYAEPLIRFLYGERWVPAAEALPALAVLGLFRSVLLICYDLLVAQARSGVLVRLQLVWLVVLVPALIVGARLDGIRGAASAQAIVSSLVVGPLFWLALRRSGVAVGEALLGCWRPVVGGLVLALVAWPVTAGLDTGRPWADLWQLGLAGASVVVVYLPIVWPLRRLVPGRDVPRAV